MHLECASSFNGTDLAVYTESELPTLYLQCIRHVQPDPHIMLLEQIQESLDWVCGGVDPNLEGNGGPACVQFLPPVQRTLETLLIALIALFEMAVTWPYLKVPSSSVHTSGGSERTMKRILLVLLCLTLGIEIGLKFASRTIIYLLNPCHMLSIIQVSIKVKVAVCIFVIFIIFLVLTSLTFYGFIALAQYGRIHQQSQANSW